MRKLLTNSPNAGENLNVSAKDSVEEARYVGTWLPKILPLEPNSWTRMGRHRCRNKPVGLCDS